jgi:hypothetical protein
MNGSPFLSLLIYNLAYNYIIYTYFVMIDHYDINGLIIFLNRGMFVLSSKEDEKIIISLLMGFFPPHRGMFVLSSKEDEKIIISLLMGFFPPHHRSRSHQTL